MTSVVGEPLSRVDGFAKVTGAAKYAAEFALPGLAHGVIVQSTIAKGRITEVDTAGAERAPGVLAVLTHLSAPKLPYRAPDPKPVVDPVIGLQIPMLQDDLVRHNGQHIALVVADTLEQATCAADLVRVAYDEEPAATSLEAAFATAFPMVEANQGGGTTASYRRGDPVRALAEAPRRLTGPTSSLARTTIRSRRTPRSPSGTPSAWSCTTRPSGQATSAATSRSPSASRRRTSG